MLSTSIAHATKLEPHLGEGKSIFQQRWKRIEHRICKEWGYCDKRKEFSDENKLLVSIIALA
jgi:hypothetical protein